MNAVYHHQYPFDPSYGYDLADLNKVKATGKPKDFKLFWENKYQCALDITPRVKIQDTGRKLGYWRIFDCYYESTHKVSIGGWLLLPEDGNVLTGYVSGHGYGGLTEPDTSLRLKNAAILMPCFRGIGRSRYAPVSTEPKWHVLHNIQDKQKYILGGCVQDIWCGITALIDLFPQLKDRIGYFGSSFGAGLGIFASAFDSRIKRAHFHVPTFANVNLRLTLPTAGSGEALRQFNQREPETLNATIHYFDAAHAAEYLTVPTHWALALFDPFVAPPGQFSAFNHAPSEKSRLVLDAGHFEYENKNCQLQQMRSQMEAFLSLV